MDVEDWIGELSARGWGETRDRNVYFDRTIWYNTRMKRTRTRTIFSIRWTSPLACDSIHVFELYTQGRGLMIERRHISDYHRCACNILFTEQEENHEANRLMEMRNLVKSMWNLSDTIWIAFASFAQCYKVSSRTSSWKKIYYSRSLMHALRVYFTHRSAYINNFFFIPP